jgi:hypothetical protein
LKDNEKVRQIYGNPDVLKRCGGDKKFAYVVALARAVNALYSAHSLMVNAGTKETPSAQRDKMNSYFFVSGILYETLKLIRDMKKVFAGDKSFETSVWLIIKDTSGQTLEQMHLKSVRHGGVFHFLPDRFAQAIATTGMTDCVFTSAAGNKKGDIHYEFADYIAAEMMVGTRLDDNLIVAQMFEKTLNLVKQFIDYSETFIAGQLHRWGFEIRSV